MKLCYPIMLFIKQDEIEQICNLSETSSLLQPGWQFNIENWDCKHSRTNIMQRLGCPHGNVNVHGFAYCQQRPTDKQCKHGKNTHSSCHRHRICMLVATCILFHEIFVWTLNARGNTIKKLQVWPINIRKYILKISRTPNMKIKDTTLVRLVFFQIFFKKKRKKNTAGLRRCI